MKTTRLRIEQKIEQKIKNQKLNKNKNKIRNTFNNCNVKLNDLVINKYTIYSNGAYG